MKKSFIFLSALSLLFILAACEDHNDDDHKHEESESITKVSLTLIDSTLKDTIRVFWSDVDGIGGTKPILPDTIVLKPNGDYLASIMFEGKVDGHNHDITEEIQAEANDHLLCFAPLHLPNVIALEIIRLDLDGKGLEIGLKSRWKNRAQMLGDVKISLKHQPGIKNGSCDIGETDVELLFPFKNN
jgi:hypothetical protein